MRIIPIKDVEEPEPIRIFNPKNPYTKKLKYSIVTPTLLTLLFFIYLSFVQPLPLDINTQAVINSGVVFVWVSGVIAASFAVGFFGAKYLVKADHKGIIYLLFLITLNPVLWLGFVTGKLVPYPHRN